jgi:hypothetical protein
LKNYYFTLGLNIYARDSEIKSMYRKLALTYHPDKNPSPEAESVFKEINEAYEVLGDPQRKLLYDQMLVGIEPQVESVSRPHRDPRYRPKPPGFVFHGNTRRRQLFELMRNNLKYAVLVSRVTLLCSTILLADYTLKPAKDLLQIVEMESSYHGRGSSVKVLINNGNSIKVEGKDASKFKIGGSIALYSSPLLSVPLKLEDKKSRLAASVPVSIYGNFIFFPLIMLLTALVGTFYWKGIEFRFNLGVMNFLLLIFNFIFLRIHSF